MSNAEKLHNLIMELATDWATNTITGMEGWHRGKAMGVVFSWQIISFAEKDYTAINTALDEYNAMLGV